MSARDVAVVEDAMAACVEFLVGHQRREGSWIDWDLPPGSSDRGTTAYVGGAISAVPGELGLSTASMSSTAARWLVDHELEDGGWGYNHTVGCDADSTAHAILFLSMEGVTIADRIYHRLLGFQQPDGGFATFSAEDGLGSLGASHVYVSAVAVRAPLTAGTRDGAMLGDGIEFVLRQRNANGIWDSGGIHRCTPRKRAYRRRWR
jgi:hypothetical protein